MSGIKLNQILKSINVYELVRIENEFGDEIGTDLVFSWLEVLTDDQLNITFDYIRTYDSIITIGVNSKVAHDTF